MYISWRESRANEVMSCDSFTTDSKHFWKTAIREVMLQWMCYTRDSTVTNVPLLCHHRLSPRLACCGLYCPSLHPSQTSSQQSESVVVGSNIGFDTSLSMWRITVGFLRSTPIGVLFTCVSVFKHCMQSALSLLLALKDLYIMPSIIIDELKLLRSWGGAGAGAGAGWTVIKPVLTVRVGVLLRCTDL